MSMKAESGGGGALPSPNNSIRLWRLTAPVRLCVDVLELGVACDPYPTPLPRAR